MDLNKLDAQMLKFDLEPKTGWNVTIFFKSNRGGLSETVYSNLSIKVTIFFFRPIISLLAIHKNIE